MFISTDYTVRIIQADLGGRTGFSFALFHISVESPVMYSPYLFDEREVIRLGKVFASQFGIPFVDPHAPRPVRRDFRLIQGGKSDGEDLQELRDGEVVLCDPDDSESGEDPLFC